MRVIAGSARRLQLKTVEGKNTRPTTDRIKETLFNMIASDMPGCRFLDLFAGSGAIGIEALSRGASEAVFVERSPKAMSVIRENLKYTKLDPKADTMLCDFRKALVRLDGRRSFDYIFLDPPYNKMIEKEVLEYISNSGLLSRKGTVIVEASIGTKFDYAETMGYSVIREKKYKTNQHVFLRLTGEEEV